MGVYVDGNLLEKYDFVSSGGWSSWAEFTVEIELTTESTSVKLVSEKGEGQFGINLDGVSLTPVEVDEPVVDPSEPSGSEPGDPSDDPEDTTGKPAQPTPPATTPTNGSTNVEPEKDYTLVIVIVVAVVILVLAVLVILTAKKVLFKESKFFDKLFKR